jgi:RNA recognition motif-containing protein
VSIPKYKESKTSKGFAFIQYQSPQEAQLAVELMNNKILDEFINTMNENFI